MALRAIEVHSIRRIAEQLDAVGSRQVSPATYQSEMKKAAEELLELIAESKPYLQLQR